jgi:hypothetical protein
LTVCVVDSQTNRERGMSLAYCKLKFKIYLSILSSVKGNLLCYTMDFIKPFDFEALF